MEKEKLAELKKRVDIAGRLYISEITGISYSGLGGKLNGYAAMSDDDVLIIESALKHAKKEAAKKSSDTKGKS